MAAVSSWYGRVLTGSDILSSLPRAGLRLTRLVENAMFLARVAHSVKYRIPSSPIDEKLILEPITMIQHDDKRDLSRRKNRGARQM